MDNQERCKAFTSQLDHLVMLAQHPGWLPYVRQRAKELENNPTGLWTGLMSAIAIRLAHIASQTQTKPD